MKSRSRWLLLALAVAVVAILMATLLWSRGTENPAQDGEESAETEAEPIKAQDPSEQEDPAAVETEAEQALPLDQTPISSSEQTAPEGETSTPAETVAEPTPNIDPTTGIELDENELPIIVP